MSQISEQDRKLFTIQDPKKIRKLLKGSIFVKPANPNALSYKKLSPLSLCQTKEKAEVLLEFGADPNLLLASKRTALFYTNSEVSKVILENNKTIINHIDEKGRNASYYVDYNLLFIEDEQLKSDFIFSYNDSVTKIALLKEYGINFNQHDIYGRNLLHYTRYIDILNSFIKEGVDVNSVDIDGNNILTTVFSKTDEDVFKLNDIKKIECLLKNGLNVNHLNKENQTAICIYYNNPEKVKLFIDYGANIYDRMNNKEKTPVVLLLDSEVYRYLFIKKIVLEKENDLNGRGAFFYTHTDRALQYFLNSKYDIYEKDNYGFNCFDTFYADSEDNFLKLTKIFLDKGLMLKPLYIDDIKNIPEQAVHFYSYKKHLFIEYMKNKYAWDDDFIYIYFYNDYEVININSNEYKNIKFKGKIKNGIINVFKMDGLKKTLLNYCKDESVAESIFNQYIKNNYVLEEKMFNEQDFDPKIYEFIKAKFKKIEEEKK